MTQATAQPGILTVAAAAIRPATLSLSLAPVALGSALAWADGRFNTWAAVAAALAAMLIQIGTNLYNDYGDGRRGADAADRLGPPRPSSLGWLTPKQVLAAAGVSFAGAALVGVYLVVLGGWPILLVGVSGILCGLAYTGGPRPLAYVGLGDLFVFLFFGLAAVAGTFYIHTGEVTEPALLGGAGLGTLATAVLVVNNLRDRITDARVGKRTLAVRFGGRFSRWQYTLLVAAAFAAALVAAYGSRQLGWCAVLVASPWAGWAIHDVWRKDGRDLNASLGATARLALGYALLASVGVVL